MFNQARYIQNSFRIVFPRQSLIRRLANEFEDQLKGKYFQPQIIPVPDELDPEVPRMIFGSEHGFSQIVVSQVSIALNVNYSPDWQTDISKGQEYLLERVSSLFELLNLLENVKASYAGLTSKVRLQTNEDTEFILHKITNYFSSDFDIEGVYELKIKSAKVIDRRYFSNLTLTNYRVWSVPRSMEHIPQFASANVQQKGLEINGDFNDRYSYNEIIDYHTDKRVVDKIVKLGIEEVNNLVLQFME